MFSYYGSKSQIINLYPKPTNNLIIEPFAGSARYSLRHWENDVILVDKYVVVVKIWKWLQQCSPSDILSLPKLEAGRDLRECNLSEEELLFLGMCAGVASTQPRFKISQFAGEQNGRKNKFKKAAENLHKIKHWQIIHGSYEAMENYNATWFVDPPYQFGGHAYVENKINYSSLSNWCKERNGQVIVCENSKANWLPFSPVIKFRGASQMVSTEVIWSNQKTNYDYQQTCLFVT